MNADTIDIGRKAQLFVKAETTPGTAVYPAATDYVSLVNGEAVLKQPRMFIEDKERRATLSKFPPFAGPYEVGSFSCPVFIKPSGTIAVVPQAACLLRGLFGKQTITPATSVVYSMAAQDTAIETFTIVYTKGYNTYWAFGSVVQKGTFPVEVGNSDTALGQGTFSGQFMRMKKAGTTKINFAAGYTVETAVVVDDATVFQCESKIEFQKADLSWLNNAGAGYLVTGVVAATNTVTFTPAINAAIADNAVVRGFVPTATDSGYLVHGRYGLAQQKVAAVDYVDIAIAKAQIELDNGRKIIADEKTNTDYYLSLTNGALRSAGITIEQIVESGHMKYFYHANAQTVFGLKIPVGNVATKRYRFEAATVNFAEPEMSGNEELRDNRKGTCYGLTAGDNELTLTFD
jgi:hypothetical protein